MMNIGFIGIGLMGFSMSKNHLKPGYNLKAFNRSQDKADRLKEFGAEISLSMIINIFDPNVFIFGGGLTNEIDFFDEIESLTKKYVIGREYEGVFFKTYIW